MDPPIPGRRLAGVMTAAAAAVASACCALAATAHGTAATTPQARAVPATEDARGARVGRLKDARIRFEINATDGDGGVHVLIDADSWTRMSVFDPSGRRVFTAATEGPMSRQGATELFLESAEPPFRALPLPRLLQRFPAGRYTFRGTGPGGRRFAGAAVLTHALPEGPGLISPRPGDGRQRPDDTTVVWTGVAPPGGSPIIGYQVLVVQAETGLRALPNVALDVTMPPSARRLRIPPGFLRPGTEYEWEVLAIERGGNQTLSSSTFTTGP